MLKYIKFGKEELGWLVAVSLVSAFILSFRQWGTETFDAAYGFRNLIITSSVVIISLFIKIYAQKYFSREWGYDVSYRPWILGLFLGILFIFLTRGVFIFLAFGGLMFKISEKMRLGNEKSQVSLSEIGWLSLIGPVISVLLALLAKVLLTTSLNADILSKFISVNLWFAAFGMVPLPFVYKFNIMGKKEFGTADGLKLLYANPLEYFIILILMFLNIFTILALSAKIALTGTIIFMILIYMVYFFFYKQNVTRKSKENYRYRL